MTIPVAPIIGVGTALAAGQYSPLESALRGDWNTTLIRLSRRLTGYDPSTGRWDWNNLLQGLVPIAAGLLIHKFVGGSPLNLNRILAQHKIPLIRI